MLELSAHTRENANSVTCACRISANVLPGIQLFSLGLMNIKDRSAEMKRCPPALDAHVDSFCLSRRFTEVRTNGNSTWRTGSWIWMGETMCSLKPLGMQNGEEGKKKTQQQEQELCNSYQFTRYFNILPHPGTGFVSGNIWVFENSNKPKGAWGIVKGCVSSNSLQILRNENPNGGRETCERNVLHPFVVCRLFQASCLSPLREFA